MNIIKHKKIFLGVSLGLVLISLLVFVTKPLNLSIEFTGGSLYEVQYEEQVPLSDMRSSLGMLDDNEITYTLQPFGEQGYLLKSEVLSEEQSSELQKTLTSINDVDGEIVRSNTIGPSIGEELKTKSFYSLLLVSLGIIIFIAWAFRGVKGGVSSWKYGLIAVIALLHDIIIPIGVLSLLAIEVNTLYVVGLLSILGLSVNDTIVVFDRIREQLRKGSNKDFDEVVNDAVNQTLTRSLMTSLTLIIVLVGLLVLGPESTKNLSLVLLLGTIVGTYSSIFLAAPLITTMVSTKEEENKA